MSRFALDRRRGLGLPGVLVCCSLSLACQVAAARNDPLPVPPRMDIEWVEHPPRPWPHARGGAAEGAGPELPSGRIEHWTIGPADRRLSIALQRWCAQTGWQLVWEAERDFPVEVQVGISGTFVEALHQVMDSLSDSDYPLQAVLNPRTQVLRVRHLMGASP